MLQSYGYHLKATQLDDAEIMVLQSNGHGVTK
jgi:hypothetical protein